MMNPPPPPLLTFSFLLFVLVLIPSPSFASSSKVKKEPTSCMTWTVTPHALDDGTVVTITEHKIDMDVGKEKDCPKVANKPIKFGEECEVNGKMITRKNSVVDEETLEEYDLDEEEWVYDDPCNRPYVRSFMHCRPNEDQDGDAFPKNGTCECYRDWDATGDNVPEYHKAIDWEKVSYPWLTYEKSSSECVVIEGMMCAIRGEPSPYRCDGVHRCVTTNPEDPHILVCGNIIE